MYLIGQYVGSIFAGFLWTLLFSILIGLFAFKDDYEPDSNARWACALGFLALMAIAALLRGLGAAAITFPFYLAGALVAYFPRRAMYRRRAAKYESEADVFE